MASAGRACAQGIRKDPLGWRESSGGKREQGSEEEEEEGRDGMGFL